MKKMFIAIVLLLGLLGLSAKDNTPQERYVKK